MTQRGWLLSRMTRGRWAFVVGLVAAQVIGAILLLLGVGLGFAPAASLIVAILVMLQVGAVSVVAMWARRRYRRSRESTEGEVVDIDRPSVGVRRTRVPTHSDVPPHTVAAFGMATRSPYARELLAHQATAGRFDYYSLMSCLASTNRPELLASALGNTDPLALLMLARVCASQLLTESDTNHSDALVRLVADHPRVGELSRSAQHMLIERLLIAGQVEVASRLIGPRIGSSLVGQLLALDVLNPSVGADAPHDAAAWLGVLNSLFRRAALDPVRLDDTAATPLERLRGTGEAGTVEGQLVSIIMTSFRPHGDALRAAVLSIIDQSWRDWELLIMDDGSPEEYAPVLDGVEALDPRVKVFRAATNEGTYVRRNEGLTRARGAYVTFHDSDDWAHPRRIEIQAQHLDRHPRSLANVSRSARVTSHLQFAQPRGTMLRITESSLLFRREEVLSGVGFFDSVRKAADSGYRRRIEALNGQPVSVVEVGAPLTLVRFDRESLSGNDLRDGWTHPARIAYTSAHSQWLAAGGVRLDHPLGTRPFPADAYLTGAVAHTPHLDVLYVLDVRDDARRRRRMRRLDSEIVSAVNSGLSVGIYRAEALTAPWSPLTTRKSLQSMINAGTLTEVIPGSGATARLVVVLDHAALVGVAGDATVLKAERALAVAHHDQDIAHGGHWSVEAAHEGARRLLGDTAVEIIPLEGVTEAREHLPLN